MATTPRSYEQRLGDLLNAVYAKTNLTGLRVGGPFLSMLEGVASSGTRDTSDVFDALNASDPTRLRGEQLDRYGRSRGVRRPDAVAAKTEVTIGDSSFVKISSRLSPLVSPPIPGQTSVRVADATAFPATGSIYVGRGTSSYEGPIAYSAKTDNGSDWTLTLSAPVTRRHDGSEEVVVAQGGNRPIPAGTVIQTQQGNALAAASFSTLFATSIPDGETEIVGVEVLCSQRGEVGNVPAGAISAFPSAPFAGATASNPRRVTTGRNIFQDQDYLRLIELVEASRSKGTPLALRQAALQVTAPDEPATCTSASYVDRRGDEPAVVTADDGTGYQPIEAVVASEKLIGSAVGGETDFQLSGQPVVKARVATTILPPWSILPGSALAFEVGGVVTEHVLDISSYPNGAEPYAVASDCNSDARLRWEAIVTDRGRGLHFRAKTELQEEIVCVAPPSGATDAAGALGLSRLTEATTLLYLNDRLLHRSGQPATLPSRPFGQWAVVSGSQTLTVNVDNTGATTYTFVDADFAGTGYSAVGRNSLTAWAAVIRKKIPGITPITSQDLLLLVSNLGPSASAGVAITGGTLVAAGFFATGSASGLAADFTLNRATSQGHLSVPLASGDSLSAGSDQTRARASTSITAPITTTSEAVWWIALDSGASPKITSANASTSYSCSVPTANARWWGDRLRLSASTGSFTGLAAGDYAVFWDPASPASILGSWLIAAVAGDGSWFELDRREGACLRDRAASAILADGRVFVCGGYAIAGRNAPLRTAEIFDPSTRTWTPAPGLMAAARADHWAVILPSGKVLVGGGENSVSGPPEIFDPVTGQFTPTSTTNSPTVAVGQKAAILGTIAYVAGGNTTPTTYLTGTWEYDEGSDTWVAGGNLLAARSRHTLTGYDGFVWAICGENAATVLGSVEAYDPGLHTWTFGPSIAARQSHAAGVSGTSLIVTGGSTNRDSGSQTRITTTDIYPLGGPWIVGPAMTAGRSYHIQQTLSGGKVLVAGGEAFVVTAEALDLGGPSWSAAGTPLLASPLNSAVGASYGVDRAVLAFGNQIGQPVAQSQSLDMAGPSWSADDPLNGATFSLGSGGVNFGAATDRLRRYFLAAGTDRTATSLQADLASALGTAAGSSVDRVRTSEARWRTNTWGTAVEVDANQPPGSFAVAAQNQQAQLFGFPSATPDDGSAGQRAWVLSGNQEVGTPDFSYSVVAGSAGGATPAITHPSLADRTTWPSPVGWIRGLGGAADSYSQPRSGQTSGLAMQFRDREVDARSPGNIYASTAAPERGWQPADRASFASPWHLGPNDYLSLVLNRDAGRMSYTPRTYRRLGTVGTTYAQTAEYLDADLSPAASLGESFGISYDFLDHAVFMRARTLTHPADASKRILWRWWQHGRGGELVDLAYANPVAPNSSAAVVVDYSSGSRQIAEVRLASGALKTGAQVRSSTMIGFAAPIVSAGIASVVVAVGLPVASALRASNATTLTLTLPPGVTDHGIPLGAVIYLASTDVNFSSGLKTVTGTTATIVVYDDFAPNVGPIANIGDISRDAGQASLAGWSPSPAVGDWLRISGSSSAPSAFVDRTMRLSSVGGPQYVEAVADHFPDPPSSTLAWGQILNPTFLAAFANPAQSATVIAAAIHAAYSSGVSPIDPTVTGSGAGIISQSTYQELGSSGASYPLRDGMNAISGQVNPASPSLNYSLTLRDPISPSLAINSDWANEDVRIVPTSADALARWLNSAATSGFGSGGLAEPASRARRLQLSSSLPGFDGAIQVTGGSSNAWGAEIVGDSEESGGAEVVTAIDAASCSGFVPEYWVAVELARPVDRGTIGATSSLDVIRPNGQLSLLHSSPKLWQPPAGVPFYHFNVGAIVESEGRFVRYQDSGLGTPLSLVADMEGSWVMISTPASPTVGAPQIQAANCGLFRVVRSSVDGGSGAHCFWVESTTHLPAGLVEADIRFFADGSVLPGDTITLGSGWGTSNAGRWTVSGLGNDGGGAYNDEWTVNLSTTDKSPSLTFGPAVLGASHTLYKVEPPSPQRWIKKIRNAWLVGDGSAKIALNGSDGWQIINAANGARLIALDKLEFPTELAAGRGAYRYHVGLVGEVNKILVGSTEDPVSYPGVEAAGSLVVVDGPKIRRIYFAVQVRTRSGYAATDVVAAVQSAVAAAIEGRPHGQPIPVSDLIRQTSLVVGVEAVVPLSPYSSIEDMIHVLPGERARVLAPSIDISVSVLGS